MTPDTISSTYPGEGIRGRWSVAPTDSGGPPRLFRPVGTRDFTFEACSDRTCTCQTHSAFARRTE